MKKQGKRSPLLHLQRFFESSMTAIAFAEANVPELATEFLTQGRTRNQTALLVVNSDHIHDRALLYAVNFCSSMSCDLSILLLRFHTFQQPEIKKIKNKIDSVTSKVNDVRLFLHSTADPIPEELKRFVRVHRRVISVIMDNMSIDQLQPERKSSKQRNWWNELDCPLVFVPVHDNCSICLGAA